MSRMNWSKLDNNQVCKDIIEGKGLLSTIHLIVEHPGGMLYETMFFAMDNEINGQWRYKTEEEAREGHAEIYAKILNGEEL